MLKIVHNCKPGNVPKVFLKGFHFYNQIIVNTSHLHNNSGHQSSKCPKKNQISSNTVRITELKALLTSIGLII